MALMTRELKASFAFVERNFNLTKRYWGWEVAFLVYAVAGALAVSLIGRKPLQKFVLFDRGQAALATDHPKLSVTGWPSSTRAAVIVRPIAVP